MKDVIMISFDGEREKFLICMKLHQNPSKITFCQPSPASLDMYACICVCVRARACVYVCMYMCVCGENMGYLGVFDI